jgi:hypothetical protein
MEPYVVVLFLRVGRIGKDRENFLRRALKEEVTDAASGS